MILYRGQYFLSHKSYFREYSHNWKNLGTKTGSLPQQSQRKMKGTSFHPEQVASPSQEQREADNHTVSHPNLQVIQNHQLPKHTHSFVSQEEVQTGTQKTCKLHIEMTDLIAVAALMTATDITEAKSRRKRCRAESCIEYKLGLRRGSQGH